MANDTHGACRVLLSDVRKPAVRITTCDSFNQLLKARIVSNHEETRGRRLAEQRQKLVDGSFVETGNCALIETRHC